jgi:hypothetical protein
VSAGDRADLVGRAVAQPAQSRTGTRIRPRTRVFGLQSTGSSTGVSPGNRSTSAGSATVASIRASAAPRQWCAPRPSARCDRSPPGPEGPRVGEGGGIVVGRGHQHLDDGARGHVRALELDVRLRSADRPGDRPAHPEQLLDRGGPAFGLGAQPGGLRGQTRQLQGTPCEQVHRRLVPGADQEQRGDDESVVRGPTLGEPGEQALPAVRTDRGDLLVEPPAQRRDTLLHLDEPLPGEPAVEPRGGGVAPVRQLGGDLATVDGQPQHLGDQPQRQRAGEGVDEIDRAVGVRRGGQLVEQRVDGRHAVLAPSGDHARGEGAGQQAAVVGVRLAVEGDQGRRAERPERPLGGGEHAELVRDEHLAGDVVVGGDQHSRRRTRREGPVLAHPVPRRAGPGLGLRRHDELGGGHTLAGPPAGRAEQGAVDHRPPAALVAVDGQAGGRLGGGVRGGGGLGRAHGSSVTG